MAEKYFAQPSSTGAQSHFSNVPSADIERSRFDRSHALKTTLNSGKLVPIFTDEVLPGDTFDLNSTAFIRMATPLKPFMDNLYADVHYFFVPYRLVWDNWQRFMGERDNPEQDNSNLTIPQTSINLANNNDAKLSNAFGIPLMPGVSTVDVSTLPFRAYMLIWNEWYRDENLQIPIPVPKDDGPDDWSLYNQFAPRGKRPDYFTSALPWPQKGDPVHIPMQISAPVITDGQSIKFRTSPGTNNESTLEFSDDPGGIDRYMGWNGSTPVQGTAFMGTQGLIADLTEATAVTINDLRTAFQIQRMLERDARGGTRYIELILSHFGVQSPDARLQRPEYLGGGTNMININPIASTVNEPSLPQGNLAATGTGVNTAKFSKSFTEHGIIIGMASIRADLTYQQGLERFWSRQTRYDFYWPTLAHLGEQAVLNKEIYIQGTAEDDNVFGYQERFAEYRYKPSRITGKMASNDALTLDYWHLAQDFDALPVLNSSFIVEQVPVERVVAVTDEPEFLMDCWFSLQCKRPMPVYSVPGLIDHF